MVARDDDQGSNSKLSYVLFGGNEDNAFTLSASGELRVIQSLDRETKEHFVLMITATDSGKSCLVVKNLFTI